MSHVPKLHTLWGNTSFSFLRLFITYICAQSVPLARSKCPTSVEMIFFAWARRAAQVMSEGKKCLSLYLTPNLTCSMTTVIADVRTKRKMSDISAASYRLIFFKIILKSIFF